MNSLYPMKTQPGTPGSFSFWFLMYIIDHFFDPAPVDKTNKNPNVSFKCLLALLLLFYLSSKSRWHHAAAVLENNTIVIVGGSGSSEKTGEFVKSK